MPLLAAPRRRVHAPISPTPNLAPWQRTAKRLWGGGGRVRAATPSEKRQPTLPSCTHTPTPSTSLGVWRRANGRTAADSSPGAAPPKGRPAAACANRRRRRQSRRCPRPHHPHHTYHSTPPSSTTSTTTRRGAPPPTSPPAHPPDAPAGRQAPSGDRRNVCMYSTGRAGRPERARHSPLGATTRCRWLAGRAGLAGSVAQTYKKKEPSGQVPGRSGGCHPLIPHAEASPRPPNRGWLCGMGGGGGGGEEAGTRLREKHPPRPQRVVRCRPPTEAKSGHAPQEAAAAVGAAPLGAAIAPQPRHRRHVDGAGGRLRQEEGEQVPNQTSARPQRGVGAPGDARRGWHAHST